MRYVFLVYGDEQAWTEPERAQCYADSRTLANELVSKGQCQGTLPLQSVATATSVQIREGRRIVKNGPFAETREQLGGFYLIEAQDMDEAITIASRIPGAKKGTVEIRPVVELDNIPELRFTGVEHAGR